MQTSTSRPVSYTHLYFTIDSLTHLVKGGRLTKTQGLVGTMLKIKPILKITQEGTVEVDDKVRSTKKALQALIDKAKGHGIDFSQRRVAVVHSYGADAVDELKALVCLLYTSRCV